LQPPTKRERVSFPSQSSILAGTIPLKIDLFFGSFAGVTVINFYVGILKVLFLRMLSKLLTEGTSPLQECTSFPSSSTIMMEGVEKTE
jgi:hypothetical protein